MKFSTSAPLSIISLLGAIANAAPVPEPDGAMDKPPAEPKNGVKAAGQTPSAEPNGMRFHDAPTLTNKPEEKNVATHESFSSKPGEERILVCHQKPKDWHKKLDGKQEDKQEKKPQDMSREHKRAEPQSPKPDSSKPDSEKSDSQKPDSQKHAEEDKEMVLVCHEKVVGTGHNNEQNKQAHDSKSTEEDSQRLEKSEDDKKPGAGAKPKDMVPTKTAQ
jgi:hypothetical protein